MCPNFIATSPCYFKNNTCHYIIALTSQPLMYKVVCKMTADTSSYFHQLYLARILSKIKHMVGIEWVGMLTLVCALGKCLVFHLCSDLP